MKASPWDNGSKEPCPRTQRSGQNAIKALKPSFKPGFSSFMKSFLNYNFTMFFLSRPGRCWSFNFRTTHCHYDCFGQMNEIPFSEKKKGHWVFSVDPYA